jgi:hypothetical protein
MPSSGMWRRVDLHGVTAQKAVFFNERINYNFPSNLFLFEQVTGFIEITPKIQLKVLESLVCNAYEPTLN